MADLLAVVAEHGGWGATFATWGWLGWMFLTGRLVPTSQADRRVDDVKERLEAEAQEKEWWREVAAQGAELGSLLARAKTVGRDDA